MKRYPLRQRAVLLGLLGLATQAFAKLGLDAGPWLDVAGLAIDALVLVGIVTGTEPLVTPIDDPKASDGEPLIRADQAADLLEWRDAVLELEATRRADAAPRRRPVKKAAARKR